MFFDGGSAGGRQAGRRSANLPVVSSPGGALHAPAPEGPGLSVSVSVSVPFIDGRRRSEGSGRRLALNAWPGMHTWERRERAAPLPLLRVHHTVRPVCTGPTARRASGQRHALRNGHALLVVVTSQSSRTTSAPERAGTSGEQRGTTVKATEPDEAASQPFAQASGKTGPECSQLPKLRAQTPWSRAGRRGLLWSTALATWLRPAGVRRGTRVPGRSACSPSWLTVVG